MTPTATPTKPSTTLEHICEVITEVFAEVENTKTGHVASYIPQLANVDPDLFSVRPCAQCPDNSDNVGAITLSVENDMASVKKHDLGL